MTKVRKVSQIGLRDLHWLSMDVRLPYSLPPFLSRSFAFSFSHLFFYFPLFPSLALSPLLLYITCITCITFISGISYITFIVPFPILRLFLSSFH